jgi:hypothetical protein
MLTIFVWYSVSSFCFSSKDTSSSRVSSVTCVSEIDTGLKNITTSIQKFAKVVVESKPCEMVFVRRKDKQAQLMVAELSPPMSVENIQLNLMQTINTKESDIKGCSLLPDGRMVFSYYSSDSIICISKDRVELSLRFNIFSPLFPVQ